MPCHQLASSQELNGLAIEEASLLNFMFCSFHTAARTRSPEQEEDARRAPVSTSNALLFGIAFALIGPCL